MPIERSIEDRHGNVIKSEIVEVADKKYRLSPRGFWRTFKNTVFGETQETPPTIEGMYGMYRGSEIDKGSITTTRRKKELTVLSDDKVEIEHVVLHKTRTLDAFGFHPGRSEGDSYSKVLEKPESIENSEIARSDRMGFPPRVEVFRWVQAENNPQDHSK